MLFRNIVRKVLGGCALALAALPVIGGAALAQPPAPATPLVCVTGDEHNYLFTEGGDFEISLVENVAGTTTDASLCVEGTHPHQCRNYLGGRRDSMPWQVTVNKGDILATHRREGDHGPGRGWHGACRSTAPTALADWVDNNGGWRLKVKVRRLK